MMMAFILIWGLNFELWHFGGAGVVVGSVRFKYKYYTEIGTTMPQVCKGEI